MGLVITLALSSRVGAVAKYDKMNVFTFDVVTSDPQGVSQSGIWRKLIFYAQTTRGYDFELVITLTLSSRVGAVAKYGKMNVFTHVCRRY